MAPPRIYRDKAAGAEARELVVSPARQRVRLPPKASKAKDNRRAERNTKAKRPRQLHLAHNKKTKLARPRSVSGAVLRTIVDVQPRGTAILAVGPAGILPADKEQRNRQDAVFPHRLEAYAPPVR